ncbi:MAG: lipopolysaccharide biosynthesis protein [Candidatus Krumholzibacteriota bacterium]|nr:lipopolysaccharide biosynthesis protein [Candidatus Krumholzibacteriota bacterium]
MAHEEMRKGRSKIAGNSISLAVSGAGGMLFTLVQLSILSRTLEGDLFGAFVVLKGFSLFLATIILIGLPQVIIRFFPSYQNRGENGKALRLFVVSSIVVLVLGSSIYLSIGRLKALLPDAQSVFSTDEILYWMVISSITVALKLILYGGFNGLREMRTQMYFEISYLAVLTALIVFFQDSLSLTALFRMISLLNGIVYVAGAPVLLNMIGRMNASTGTGDAARVVQPVFLSYMGYSLVLSFVALAFTDFDRFVMSSVLPLSAISIFHVASRINSLIKRFLGFPVIALQPEVTRIYEEGRWEQLPEKITLFTKTTVIAAFFFSVLAALAGNDVILLLSGKKYEAAYPVMLVLLAGVPIAAFIAPVLTTMRGLNHIKWAALCDFLWMAVYFGSFFIFVTIWGVTGMAIAQVLASIVQMAAAVALSKKEGFYGGLGKNTVKAIIFILLLAIPLIMVTRYLGIYAVISAMVFSPLILRILLVKLRIFESAEIAVLKGMIPQRAGQRFMVWLIDPEA